MIFEQDSVCFNLIDIIRLDQSNINITNNGRNFDALSFRYKADTVLKNETSVHHLKNNSVCFVPSRVNYSRTSKTDELIVIHFSVLNYHSKSIESFMPKEHTRLAELFGAIFDCWSKKSTGYKHKCSAMLCDIFCECYKENHSADESPSKIKNSVRYITENFKNPEISVKKAAERSFMSEVYFRKLFKSEFGVSPKKHIINLRLQYARGLMSTGYYSLQEISEMCGFNDYKYFSVEFKKNIGVSPSKYLYNYL